MADAVSEIQKVDELLRRIRPFLRELAGPLKRRVDREEYGQYDVPRNIEEHFLEGGLVLVDRYTEVLRSPGDARQMDLGGTCLVLVVDGHFAEIQRWGSSWYSGENTTMKMRHLSTADALAQYGFAGCTDEILEALGNEGVAPPSWRLP